MKHLPMIVLFVALGVALVWAFDRALPAPEVHGCKVQQVTLEMTGEDGISRSELVEVCE